MGTRHEELIEALRELAQSVVADLGIEVVELTLRGSSRRRLLRLDIDRPGPDGVGIDDCQRVSADLGSRIDDASILDESYVLEVSSPGLDRPIVSPDDYRRNTGRRVVLTTRREMDGRRQFNGVLLGLEAGCVGIREDDRGESRIGIDEVESVRQEIEF